MTAPSQEIAPPSPILSGFKFTEGPSADPNGGAYITDPHYQRDYWRHTEPTQPIEGVYYLAPGSKELLLVDGSLVKPNGIIGTSDGRTLFVADIRGDKTWRYTIAEDGTLHDKALFCSMGSDGMTLDSEGRLYITGKGVTIFDSEGIRIGHIPIPEPWTSNVTIGGPDGTTLFITASAKVYAVSAHELARYLAP